MTRDEKIAWMAVWAAKQGCALALEGEVGFGRECVGVTRDGNYPDFRWFNETTYERADPNGEVWVPEDAYHKHDCVAVLGRGEAAEARLYEWLKWFDEREFKVTSEMDTSVANDVVALVMGKQHVVRITRGLQA